jgi:hypothetical protein
MNRTETYASTGEQHKDRGRTVKDLDTWAGNSLATILAGLAVAAGVIGMLVAFGQIREDNTNPFEDGLIWMIGGVILAISANVFRREHHVVDANMSMAERPLQGGSMGRGYDRPGFEEEPRGRAGSSSVRDDVRSGTGDYRDDPRTRPDDMRTERRTSTPDPRDDIRKERER